MNDDSNELTKSADKVKEKKLPYIIKFGYIDHVFKSENKQCV